MRDVIDLLRGGGVVALTGAGMSTESGIPDYRGPDGSRRVTPMTIDEFRDGEAGARRYWSRAYVGWNRFRAARANAGHAALARIQSAGCLDAVITQNVDGLHQDAGSTVVLEVHGSAARARCLNPRCGWKGASAYAQGDTDPTCPRCDGPQRPDLVLFGESLDPLVWSAAEEAASSADVFLAVGTSAVVTPAKWLAPIARDGGALCVNVNIDPAPKYADPFHHTLVGPADEVLGAWL